MPTQTSLYSLYKPLVNDATDQDLWGSYLNTNADTLDASLPAPGTLQMFAAATPPIGWLECNGVAISRTTYANLFAAIGTAYGSGDGSTTFNIPDFRGYFPRGWDDGAGVDSGRVFGSIQADGFAAHNHPITDPGHSHPLPYSGSAGSGGNTPLAAIFGVGSTGSSATGISINSTGGAETRPKNLAVLFIIKS